MQVKCNIFFADVAIFLAVLRAWCSFVATLLGNEKYSSSVVQFSLMEFFYL